MLYIEAKERLLIMVSIYLIAFEQRDWRTVANGTAVVVQTLPNSTKCGGLTEAWRIGWMAYEHNIQLVPHGWNTAIGLAADLHLTAALPVARYVEFLTPSPYVDELIAA